MADLTFYTSRHQGENIDDVVEKVENFYNNSEEKNIIIPVENGGTGNKDGAKGLANLFAAGATILTKGASGQYGTELPSNPKEGQLFFQQADDLATLEETAGLLYPINSVYFTTANLDNTGPSFGSTTFSWSKIGSFTINSTTIYAWKRTA